MLYYEEVRVHTSSSFVLSNLPVSLCFMLRRLTLCIVISSYLVEHVLYRMAHEKPARRLVDQRGRRSRFCTGN